MTTAAAPTPDVHGWATAPARGRRRGWTIALTASVVAVWLCNGLVFKLLHGLPRHLAIVQSMPGLGGSRGVLAIQFIGGGEVLLAAWILSGIYPRVCAAFQTVILLAMNTLELIFARNHLLSPLGLVPVNCAFLCVAWCAAELRTREPFYWLRRHPFPVDALLVNSLVLTYALPRGVLEPLLPPGLQLDAFGDFGILAVAMVQTNNLRPNGFPPPLGRDFVLTGYRIFTTLKHKGRTRRGLFILRSDVNRQPMVVLGNLLTHYKYRLCDAQVTRDAQELTFCIRTKDGHGDVEVSADLVAEPASLANHPVFPTEHDARRYAGPLPYTFDYEARTNSIIMIKGERQTWSPRRVSVDVRRVSFLEQPPFSAAQPIFCSAFYVQDVPYHWRRGVRVSLDDGAV